MGIFASGNFPGGSFPDTVLNHLKIFKAVYKNNPRMHSPQQPKKAMLTTAAHFKVPTLVRSQRQQPYFVYLRLPKSVFSGINSKSERHHSILHILINLVTKFQLKLTSLIFWTKFA